MAAPVIDLLTGEELAPELLVGQGLSVVCRDYLDAYGSWVHGLKPAKHHAYWVEEIMKLLSGQTSYRNLLILAPPGHAKSHWVSQTLPNWYLGNHPSHSLLFFTSSDNMAHQFGNVVKLTFENPRHRLIFGEKAQLPNVKRGWSSEGLYLYGIPDYVKDPSYRALGYGASVIGARADGVILDDPLTQESSQSPQETRKAKTYFDMTIATRRKPGSWTIAIMTLWHELDLGMFLAGKDDWHVIKLPALALEDDVLGREPGEALWPELFPRPMLERLREEPPVGIGLGQFNAAYQQDPIGLGGDVFRPGDFQDVPSDFWEPRADGKAPVDRLKKYQFWDLAWGSQDRSDFTVGVTAGLDSQNRLYVLDVVRFRAGQKEVETHIVDAARRWEPTLVGVEESTFHKVITQQVLFNVRKDVRVPVRGIPTAHDKRINAQLAAHRGQAGLLYVDKRAPWWPVFCAELLAFDRGAHDDQVDALSGICQLLATGQGVRPAARPMVVAGTPRVEPRRLPRFLTKLRG